MQKRPQATGPLGYGAEDPIRTVAHDLRSPLCALRAFLRLLERDCGPALDARGDTYLERIFATLDRMQGLVDDLLGSAPESMGSRAEWVDAREICMALVADLKPLLDEQGIEVTVSEAPPPVYAVRSRLQRVLSNLVCNAIQHMGRTRSPRIRIGTEPVEGGVEVRVADNGRGIPPSLRQQVFDPLCGNGASRDAGRSRLGLAIVRAMVESHGGRVSLDSPPGRGTTFRAFFPDPRHLGDPEVPS